VGFAGTVEERVCVVGLGRIGLPLASLYADAGVKVVGVDSNQQVVELVGKGVPPFQEPGLDELLKRVVAEGRLRVECDRPRAAAEAQAIILIVPTLVNAKKDPDYSILEEVSLSLGRGLKPGSLVLVESTVAPGVTESIVGRAVERSSGLKAGEGFKLAYSPIRASSGRILQDLAGYPRVVGGLDGASLEEAARLVAQVSKGGVVRMSSIKAAEAVKLFENVYRDVNIALANELSAYCQRAGLDYMAIAEAANTQPFCHLLRPGIVGGKCIPVNPYFLIKDAQSRGVPLSLVKAGRRVNEGSVKEAIRLIAAALERVGFPLKGARVGVLGVSYKADVKEDHLSPAKMLQASLRRRGAKPVFWDPYFSQAELEELGFEAAGSLERLLEVADCVVVAVGHKELAKLKGVILEGVSRKGGAVVDCSGLAIFKPQDSAGRAYCYTLGIGVAERNG